MEKQKSGGLLAGRSVRVSSPSGGYVQRSAKDLRACRACGGCVWTLRGIVRIAVIGGIVTMSPGCMTGALDVMLKSGESLFCR